MDKNKSMKIVLVTLIAVLILAILIYPSQEKGKFQGTTIGKVHSVVQDSLEKGVDAATGSAVNIKASASTPIYALTLLIIALSILIILYKKKY